MGEQTMQLQRHLDKLIREPYFILSATLAQACPQDLVSMMLKLWTWETVNAHSENPLSEYFVEPGFKVLDFLAYGMLGSKLRQ